MATKCNIYDVFTYFISISLLAFSLRKWNDTNLEIKGQSLSLNVTAKNCCREDILIFNRVPKVSLNRKINKHVAILGR